MVESQLRAQVIGSASAVPVIPQSLMRPPAEPELEDLP